MNQHLLITGKPGVGKTTLVTKVITEIKEMKPNWLISGFYTKELRQSGRRIGFDIYTLDGQQGILARSNDPKLMSKFRVGKYSVVTTDLEDLVVPLLYESTDLLILDELGKMELFSSKFRNAVIFAFNNQTRIFATLPFYENPFLASIKSRSDIKIWELTQSNRLHIFEEIVKFLEI
ncbi:MAG: NTPase [Candidatus Heimdallarchaeota archaeon]|nr:MAG: NTPase [Candidatus Heimdallarchaeota archaeon]